MTSAYAILATVELLHEYYTDGRCPDFSFSPDEATARLLLGAGILHKSLGNALVLLTKVDEIGIADRRLPTNAVMRFQLNLEQSRMLNYSNLEIPEGFAYYFSNRLETARGTDFHLNSPVPAFNTTAEYAIGAMVSQGAVVFEAIRPVNSNDHAPGDSAYWEPRSEAQYVHNNDRIRRNDGRIRLNVAPAAEFSISTFAFNPESEAFDLAVGNVEQQRFEAPVSAIAIDRSSLAPGRYRIAVGAQNFELLIDREGTQSRSLGLIELWNLGDAASVFSLYENDGTPRGSRFVLRFANRLAIWKYRLKTNTATGISIPGQPGVFVAGSVPQEYISSKPLPLREQAIRNIQLMRGTDVLANRLANPPPDRISQHTDGSFTWYCAEMRLNY